MQDDEHVYMFYLLCHECGRRFLSDIGTVKYCRGICRSRAAKEKRSKEAETAVVNLNCSNQNRRHTTRRINEIQYR